MGSTDPAAAILPFDLGDASAYDQLIFPLAYYVPGDDLTKGSILIKATLEEMDKIRQLGIDLNKNANFIFNTRLTLEALKVKKETLQDKRKTLNPFKAFINYRAARLFHAASKDLFLKTKRASEKIQREEERVQVVPTTQIRIVDGAVPPDVKIGGVLVDLPNGWNDDAERTINEARETIATTTDPFQDNSLIPQLGDDEYAISLANTESLLGQESQDVSDSGADKDNCTSAASTDLPQSRSTSPRPINLIQIYNSVVTTNSNLTGFTYNRASHSRGASVTQESTP